MRYTNIFRFSLTGIAAAFLLCATVAAAPVRVAAVGDSITYGIGTANPAWYAYPAQLQRMLGETWLVGNFGSSGSTLLKQGNHPYQQQDAFRQAREFKPDIVVIMLGTNDTKPQNWKLKDQFVADYKDLIRQFKALESKPRIFICRPPYVAGQRQDGINEPAVLEQLPLIDTIARDENAGVIDVHGALLGKDSLLPDTVHPNTAGATEIAKVVYTGLTGKTWTEAVPAEFLSQWSGFPRRDFFINGRTATLVAPKNASPGKPWIWRTEFFGAFPSVDLALLAAGWHVAYINVQNLYGAPVALDAMDGFYSAMVNTEKLAPKAVIEGFSRGGLFALNWAARNPGKVAALYLDAPVCDFKSWPGGKGKGKGSPGDWAGCLKAYGLTEEEALKYPLNPVDHLQEIADAKIPIVAVAGDADDTVPLDENIGIVEKRYRALGGQIQVIVKPGAGHHPHSLADPAPVVDFLLQRAIH